MADSSIAEPELTQLGPADHAVLSCGEALNLEIGGASVTSRTNDVRNVTPTRREG